MGRHAQAERAVSMFLRDRPTYYVVFTHISLDISKAVTSCPAQ